MSNYSYATSLEPYRDNATEKKRQADELYQFIRRGANSLLQLAELSGLPQSTVSGRVNDLIFEKRIEYKGKTIYKNRERKKIVVKVHVTGVQNELFA